MIIGGVEISPGISNAACSVAKSIDDVKALAATKIGAVLVGSITIEPRDGNTEPRWFVGDNYALNSFGMPNPGAVFYAEHLPEMIAIAHAASKKFILSVAGFATDEYTTLATLANTAGVDIIELNFGCPNISLHSKQKPIVSFDQSAIEEIIQAVSEVTDIPLMVKLSPYSNPAELSATARTITSTGKVSGVVTMNTFANSYMAQENKPVLGAILGGLSGNAVLPIGLGQVKQLRNELPDSIAVIGVGGIESPEDAKLYRQAGADGVQVATLIVRDGHAAINRIAI